MSHDVIMMDCVFLAFALHKDWFLCSHQSSHKQWPENILGYLY